MSQDIITSGKARRFCFTIFPASASLCTKLSTLVDSGFCTYLCFQIEICPTTKREHIQGYIEYKAASTWNRLPKELDLLNKKGSTAIGKGIRITRSRGTPEQNKAYCSKDSDRKPGTSFHEYGDISGGQGTRNDLLEVKAQLDNGTAMIEIADGHFGTWIRYHKHFETYCELKGIEVNKARRFWKSIVICLTGASGAGKTKVCHELFPGLVVIQRGVSGLWFGNYKGHEVVLFDEFSGATAPHSLLLQLLDRYPMDVDCKGASATWLPKVILLTSNKAPADWYKADEAADRMEMWNALERRIDCWIEAFRCADGEHDYVAAVRKCQLPAGHPIRPELLPNPLLQSEDYICSLCSTAHPLVAKSTVRQRG